MTLGHLASTALFLGVIGMSVWTIVDSFRREWPMVARAFGIASASTCPWVEATSRPAGRPPVVGGATGEVR